jgi:hypothetical protein
MIVQMPGGSELVGKDVSAWVCSPHAKAGISREPIIAEVEIVVDEERLAESVVPNAITMHPWIAEGQREDENQQQNFVVRA